MQQAGGVCVGPGSSRVLRTMAGRGLAVTLLRVLTRKTQWGWHVQGEQTLGSRQQ